MSIGNEKCPGGGIGRRASLRGWSRQRGAGSSPVLGTMSLYIRIEELGQTKPAVYNPCCHWQTHYQCIYDNLKLPMCPSCGDTLFVKQTVQPIKRYKPIPNPDVDVFYCMFCNIRWNPYGIEKMNEEPRKVRFVRNEP